MLKSLRFVSAQLLTYALLSFVSVPNGFAQQPKQATEYELAAQRDKQTSDYLEKLSSSIVRSARNQGLSKLYGSISFKIELGGQISNIKLTGSLLDEKEKITSLLQQLKVPRDTNGKIPLFVTHRGILLLVRPQ